MTTLDLDFQTPTALTLRPYQEEAVAAVLAKEQEGVMRQLGVAGTGMGKALRWSEKVLTPKGWRQISDLAIGDSVMGSDGRPTEVLGVFPQGKRPIYRVTFSDGAEVECDDLHLWTVRTRADRYRKRPWRTLSLNEIRSTDLRHGGGWRWEVPMALPPVFQEPDLPLDPYLLGILLGDGGFSVPARTTLHTECKLAETLVWPEPVHLTKMHDDGPNGIGASYYIGGSIGCSVNPVTAAIRSLGLSGLTSHDKFVPDLYMFASEGSRMELLRGILDADGHPRSDGHVECTLVSRRLADGTAALVRSLGGTARVVPKKTTWTHLGVRKHGIAYKVSIAMPTCPFRWKASRWSARTKYAPQRKIRKIEAVGIDGAICIKVAAPDGLFIVNDYVVTHNTLVFAEVARRLQRRTLILAHRDELIRQAAEKIQLIWPGVPLGVVKAERNEIHAPVVLASVQSLSRQSRLDKARNQQFGLIIVDEAHHAKADGYKRILQFFGCFEENGPLLLGVTATPDRGDKQGLDDVFDEIVFNYDMRWGIKNGYLSDIHAKQVMLQLDLDSVKTSRGDYQDGSLSDALIAADAPEHIYEAWNEHASDRKTVVFTPTVEMARLVSEEFVRNGVRAGWASGATHMDERRETLDGFSRGDLQVVANCALLTEGYDEPSIDCIVMARPTKSRSFYAQVVGRGTRKYPGKTSCLILDVVGVARKHSLATVASLLGLKESDMRKGMGAREGIAIQDNPPPPKVNGKMVAEDVNIWEQFKEAEFAWVRTLKGFAMSLSDRIVALEPHGNGYGVIIRRKGAPDSILSVTKEGVPVELAQGIAEDYARKNQTTKGYLIDKSAAWRTKPATPKQIEALKKFGYAARPDMTAGEASDLMTAKLASKGRRQYR